MDPMTMAALAQMGMQLGQDAGLSDSVMGGLTFGLSGRKAKKAKRKAQKRFQRALNLRESVEGGNLQKQEAFARQATAQQLAGFDAAKNEAARMGRTSKQSALDREQQLGATLTQNLQNRGLGSLTVGGGHMRGITADTQRQMSGINEGLAGLLGELAMGRAGAEAQGTANIAGIAGQQADLMSQLGQMRLLGGATAGPIGSFDPGSFQSPNSGQGENVGALLSSFGQNKQSGDMDDLMAMIKKLFEQGGGGGYGSNFIGPQMPGY